MSENKQRDDNENRADAADGGGDGGGDGANVVADADDALAHDSASSSGTEPSSTEIANASELEEPDRESLSEPKAGSASGSPDVEEPPAEPGLDPIAVARAAALEASAGSAAAAAATSATPTVAEPAPAKSSGGAAPIAWLALVLVLVLAGAGFYMVTNLQQREGLLLQRVQGLEAVSGRDDSGFDQLRSNLERQIELEVEGLKAQQQRAEEDLQRALQRQTGELKRVEGLAAQATSGLRQMVDEQVAPLQSALSEQQQRIADLSVEDRESWLLAEAQYLLRLANQRLIMTGDTASAEALLRSADNILRELGDADLHDLRAAVAGDLAAVRAVPKLDIQGLYLRLDALIRQTDALVLFELPERAVESVQVDSEDWKARLAQGYESAIAKLSEYIVVSRRDVPVEALMDPQYEGLVRQNMRMLLEQAQVAMLSGNEVLFRQSLERAEGWVTQFFKSDEQSALAMAEELRLIRDERVAVSLPDLNQSLTALDAVMRARLARGGN